MGAFVTPVFAFLRGIPILAYVCAALAAGLLYERHEATAYKNALTLLKAENAGAKIEALTKAVTESKRRNDQLQGEIDDAKKRAAVSAADAASAASAAARVSGELSAVKRRFAAAGDPSAAPELKATREAVGVLADLLGERQRAGAARSRFADEAAGAAAGCARQYESLTPAR